MRKIFSVNGKLFYSESQFKKYVLKNKLTEQWFQCKFGIYWKSAKVTRHTNRLSSGYSVKSYSENHRVVYA